VSFRDANDAGAGPHTITVHPPGDTFACAAGDTVLSAILRAGAKVFFGCRGGGCGTCKMRLVTGEVDHGRCSTAVLTEHEKHEGAFLSCQARPLTDLTVELTPANRYRPPRGRAAT